MATRYDLGENSCRIAVASSDKVLAIFDAISNFLVTKNWTRCAIFVDEANKTGSCTFSGTNIDGTEKRFSIQVVPKEVGSSELVAIVFVHNSQSQVTAANQQAISLYNWTSRFYFRPSVANNIYIFASPRWALFTSQSTKYGVGGVSIPEDEGLVWPYPNYGDYGQYGNYYGAYYQAHTQNTIWFSSQDSMDTLGSVLDYTGPSLTVPKEYNYFQAGSEDYYMHPSLYTGSSYLGYNHQTASPRLEPAKIKLVNKGLTGCIEILTPSLQSLNWEVDLVKLSSDYLEDGTFKTSYINSQLSISGKTKAIFGDTTLDARLCGIFGEDKNFGILQKGKSALKNPYNDKNILVAAHGADNKNNYLGSALGIKITQADLSFTTSFLAEVWLNVDDNWNLDQRGGVGKKFFVVPGGCEFNDYLPDRNWVWLNTEHTAVIPASNIKVSYYYQVSSYYDNGSYEIPSMINDATFTVPIYGYWKNGKVATKKYSHTSFLIPA